MNTRWTLTNGRRRRIARPPSCRENTRETKLEDGHGDRAQVAEERADAERDKEQNAAADADLERQEIDELKRDR